MIVRALDANHDWTFGKGKNDYLRYADAITQKIDTRLNEFLGDCFFSISSGVDWFGLLGQKGEAAKLKIKLAVNAIILNTEGVSGIVETTLRLDADRKLTINYSVNTIYTLIVSNTTTIEL